MEKVKENFLKRKATMAVFAAVALLGGILFLDNSAMTGNAVLNNATSITPLTYIGMLLIFSSMILSAYIIFKK